MSAVVGQLFSLDFHCLDAARDHDQREAAMLGWQVGAVKITRIVELQIPIPYNRASPFWAEATPEALRAIPWLYPNFVNEEDQLLLSIHALLVDAPGLPLVADTCIGSHRPRSILRG